MGGRRRAEDGEGRRRAQEERKAHHRKLRRGPAAPTGSGQAVWPATTERQPCGPHSRPLAPSTHLVMSASGSSDCSTDCSTAMSSAVHFTRPTAPAALAVRQSPEESSLTGAAGASTPGTLHFYPHPELGQGRNDKDSAV